MWYTKKNQRIFLILLSKHSLHTTNQTDVTIYGQEEEMVIEPLTFITNS